MTSAALALVAVMWILPLCLEPTHRLYPSLVLSGHVHIITNLFPPALLAYFRSITNSICIISLFPSICNLEARAYHQPKAYLLETLNNTRFTPDIFCTELLFQNVLHTNRIRQVKSCGFHTNINTPRMFFDNLMKLTSFQDSIPIRTHTFTIYHCRNTFTIENGNPLKNAMLFVCIWASKKYKNVMG